MRGTKLRSAIHTILGPRRGWEESAHADIDAQPAFDDAADYAADGAFLGERFPHWMLPDDVVVLDELPHTATGKIMKAQLREMSMAMVQTPTGLPRELSSRKKDAENTLGSPPSSGIHSNS